MDKEVLEQESLKENESKTRIKPLGSWKERSKASKTGTIIAISICVIVIIGLFLLAFCRQLFGDSVGDQILGKGVSNGFVYMWNGIVSKKGALFGTLITIFTAIVLTFIVNLIVNLCTHKSKRSRTIGSLIKSLFKYIAVIVAFGVILSLWGVNVAGIVAGVGIITLVVGLGCQSLVNDCVSGIFIVTDSYFEVGDIVIIDGFRGTVVSVGLRTTKIRDWCNNIKSITNSNITSVVNISRYTSNALVYFTVPFDKDLRKVEAIIQANMEQIEKNIPFLTGKIIYKGITEITEKGAKMFFAAPCDEDNRYQVERDLLREIYLLFADNDIGYGYNQVQLNKPRDGAIEKPSDEDIKNCKKLSELAHKSETKKMTSKKIVKKMVVSLVDDSERDDED